MAVIPTLYPIGDIRDPNVIRVVIYINNTLCHVPLNKILSLIPAPIEELRKEIESLKERVSALENKSGNDK